MLESKTTRKRGKATKTGDYEQVKQVRQPSEGGVLTHHIGILPESYIKKLEAMSSLKEIAAEAALMRSDGGRCGTATAKILKWVCSRLSSEEFNAFMKEYVQAWVAEKQARAEGRSSRPVNRPVKGGRTRFRRDSRDRHGFAASYC